MAKEPAAIDGTHLPELLRVAEDVRATNTPPVLRRNDEDIAVVIPVASISRERRTPGTVAHALAAGFQAIPALPKSISVEEMTRIAAEEHAQACRRIIR
jgi:hypothetical protein